jgi:hypothetical protein
MKTVNPDRYPATSMMFAKQHYNQEELMMRGVVFGGKVYYGQVVGILMMDLKIPSILGDPGYDETFPLPVLFFKQISQIYSICLSWAHP